MTRSIDLSDLAQFTGTECYYKHWLGQLVLTEGVKFLCDNGHAWFVDVIASVQPELKLPADEFQFWELNLKAGHGTGTATCKISDENGETSIVKYQQWFHTDSELDGLKVWVKDRVVLLPSEY